MKLFRTLTLTALTLAPALAAAADHPDAWVLGADTIVVIDGRVLGKP